MRTTGTVWGGALLALLFSSVALAGDEAAQSCAQGVLERYSGVDLAYRVGWKGLSLDSKRRIDRLEDGHWSAVNLSSLLFMGIEESSRFSLNNGQILSERYDYQRRGLSKKQNLRIEFSAQGYNAYSPKGDGSVDYTGPIFDLFNHQLQLQVDLACGEPRDTYTYPIARRNRVSEYTYRRIGEERVKTQAGEMDALLLERGDPGDKLDRVWLAPELGYLIVKLVHQEDDDKAELQLVKLPAAKE